MYKCKFCNADFNKSNLIAGHVRWCDLNPNRKKRTKRIPHPLGIRAFSGRRHTEEAKKIMSEKRKKYLAENKDKHNWSRYSNKESEPEKRFRELVEKTNLSLVQWYIPPESNRLYEMDFADPVNKIDFEINGNQHYTPDGYLNQYYQERHDYFVSLGWKVIEIHYSTAFVESQLIEILNLCYNDFSKAENKIKELSDGRKERQRLLEEKRKQESQLYEVDWSKHKFTQKQIDYQLKSRKVVRPSKEELYKLVWEKSSTQIAKDYGVSDNSIKKWCKKYNISKPPRGYWAKFQNNKL